MMAGNMYPKTKGINPLLGSCQHDCSYCYRNKLMWRFKKDGKGLVNHWKRYHGMPRLDPDFDWQKALGGKAKTIFVCDMTDLFAENVPLGVREAIIRHCCEFPQHEYLWHTKNPKGLNLIGGLSNTQQYPPNSILVVTIETNRDTTKISSAPMPRQRVGTLVNRPARAGMPFADALNVDKLQLSLEPITDFSLDAFLHWIDRIKPDIVSIGADTGGNKLPEPSEAKLIKFVGQLRKVVPDVRIKDNLRRLWPDVEVP